MDEVWTRLADGGETDTICALIAEFYDLDGHDYDAAAVRAVLPPLLGDAATGQGLVVLVLRGDVVDGYAVVTWGYSLESGGREALLDELYVRTRGDGVGARLLDAVFVASRRHGARRIFLETERPNGRVRQFYARYGFEEEDSIWLSRSL